MAHDHNSIYTIVERLRILEEGLDKNQRSVNQLSATFKPKTVAVLTAKKDPKNPLAGKLVGGSESAEHNEPMLEADMAEDVLAKVEKSFKDFIRQAEEQIKDSDIKEKKHEDNDLKNKDKKDRGLKDKPDSVAEESNELDSALSGIIPAQQPAGEPGVSIKESVPIKTVALMDGMICEIHGNERDGFEIRRGLRSLPTRFKDMMQAEMALEMYQARMKKADESQDYLEEQ
jgi:hypothetical protein